jgi:hypothetical protein
MSVQLGSREIKFRLLGIVLLTVTLLLITACSQPAATAEQAVSDCPQCPDPACPEPTLYEEVWASSAHADGTTEAFVHWDEDDPPAIPTNCAKCHSLTGYLDFAGADGTTVGVVDRAVAPGTTVTCFACHHPSTADVSSVLFPSGVRIRNMGTEARCVQCHQGRASTANVNDTIAAANVPDDDAFSEELAFVNTHSISGATPFGGEVHGGYEYYGREYQGRYLRAGDFFACFDCHEKHSLELQYALCKDCHTSARTDPSDIRVDTTDYDGDGDMDEGIADEIDALYGALYVSIQNYARDIVDTPIAFDGSSYPYYFIDSNNNGQADSDEANMANRFNAWTPRLLRAAYNLNYVAHDHGAYAHNPDYVIQLLYDSLEDIGGDISQLTRPAVRRVE